MPRIDAPIALAIATLTAGRLITGCAWTTAHEAQLEAAACDLVHLADLAPGLDALACQGSEEALRAAVTEAARTSPSAAPSPVLVPVQHPSGRTAGHVPRHLAPRVRELLAVDAGR